MTLSQIKEDAVKLIDEYSNNANLTDDEDIRLKLNNLCNLGQIELSLIKKIRRTYEFVIDEESETEYRTIELPDNFMEENRLRYFSSNNSILNYYIQDNKLKVHKSCLGNFEFEYYAKPQEITNDTPDTYELEIDLVAQQVLPYYVASDILKSDVSANYTAFEAKYNAKMEILMNSIKKEDNGLITINQMIGNL